MRSLIKEGLSKRGIKKWDLFCEYLRKTWIPILDNWSICDENGDYKKVLKKTNNGLERYNRCFNGLFEGKKPSPIVNL